MKDHATAAATRQLKLTALRGTFAVCRLPGDTPTPEWSTLGEFSSATRSEHELSLVVEQERVPDGVQCDRGWRGWRIAGTFPLATATGVLAAVSAPLADAGVSIFVVSTFDTDYVLVKQTQVDRAAALLREHGHVVEVA